MVAKGKDMMNRLIMAAGLMLAGAAFAERTTSLCGADWKFRRDPSRRAQWSAPELDETGWESVRVPHDWAIAGPFDPDGDGDTAKLPWRGTGWYRRTFTANPLPGGRTYLRFGGVMAGSRVYVNGVYAGGFEYGFLGGSLDVTEFVKPGENALAVRADTVTGVPEKYWGIYPGAGIFRPVYLVEQPARHVLPDSIAITTPFVSATAATVHVEAELSDGWTNFTFTVRNPRLWDVDDPHLYELELCGERFRYGIRTFEFTADDGFHLNGRRVQLKGANLHEDFGPLGLAWNESARRRQLQLLKDMGVNALRLAHYPHAPEALDLCDEMGFVTWDEAYNKWSGGLGRPSGVAKGAQILKTLVDLVHRDRNHPSVVCWSAGNELQAKGVTSIEGEWWAYRAHPEGTTAERVNACVAAIRAADPTRPVAMGCCNSNAVRRGHLAGLDICGWNYANIQREMRRFQPKTPMLYSEAGAMLSQYGDYGEREPFLPGNRTAYDAKGHCVSAYGHLSIKHTDVIDCDLHRTEKNRYMAGLFLWNAFDNLGEPTPYDARMARTNREMGRSSLYGACDLTGVPKDTYWLMRAEWNPEALTLHILPHWNWPGCEGRPVPVYVYTNGDEAELFLNGKSQGRRAKRRDIDYPLAHMWDRDKDVTDFRKNPYYDILDKYRLRWLDVPYEPGELRVVAYRNGRKIGERTMRTAGDPARVALTPERADLPADGETLAYVQVDVLDAKGVRCPRAANRVFFRVEGPAAIEAVGNGGQFDLDSFKDTSSHRLFNGKAVVILRRVRGGTAPVRLTASADGLAPASVGF